MSGWISAAGAVGRRPRLWGVAIRQARRLARPGWWHRPPFLPVPAREYLAFRAETQYGDAKHQPTAPDVVNYLSWCQQMDRA